MRYLMILGFPFLFLSCVESIENSTLIPSKLSEISQSTGAFDTILEEELIKMKTDITFMEKDSILLSLIFSKDSTVTIITELAIKQNNYLGFLMFMDSTTILIYSKNVPKYITTLMDTSKIINANPTGYYSYDSVELLPPFEPYIREYKFRTDSSLEFIKKGFF